MGAKLTFGRLIKQLRLSNTEYSLRKLAEIIGISPAYLSRLEAEKDPPPSEAIIIKMARILGADKDELLSCADKVSPDILRIIKKDPRSVPSFLRLAGERGLSGEDWDKVSRFVETEDLGKKKR